MKPLLIDVTRLLKRAMLKKTLTGVDRVILEYVRYYANRAHAVVKIGRRFYIFSLAASYNIFQWVLSSLRNFSSQLLLSLLKGTLFGWPKKNVKGGFFLNVSHSGIEFKSYQAWLKQLGVIPVFMIHDLIPITHPEYCKAFSCKTIS